MDQLIEQHRDQIKRLAALRGAQRVRVFGSRAGDNATPESDVDILVDLEKGRSALALGGLDIRDHQAKKIPSKTWRECIKKVWEVDPLACPHCGAEMKIVSLSTKGRSSKKSSNTCNCGRRSIPVSHLRKPSMKK